MKILYLLAAMMLIGIILISVTSYKVFTAVKKERTYLGGPRHRTNTPAVQPETRMYVVMSYLGITLFVVGSFGAIVVLLQSINRRF